MGIVQFMNYLRLFQFVAHVSALNENLQCLCYEVRETKTDSDSNDVQFHTDYLSTSTALYDKIEDYRKLFGRIWKLHVLINQCFGFSILVITLNILLSIAFSLYLSVLSHSKNITVEFIVEPSLSSFHIIILFIFMINTCEKSDALVNRC